LLPGYPISTNAACRFGLIEAILYKEGIVKNDLLVTRREAEKVEVDQYLTIFNYFTKEEHESASIVVGHLDGPHGNRINNRSAKIYFVLSGKLDITVDECDYHLSDRDCLWIPANKWHKMVGQDAEMIIMTVPAYDFEDEIVED
jgi:mannose-6-phosphate isomerase-like protein (cupin superfamily)